MTVRELSFKLLDMMDFLTKHNQLELALVAREASKFLDSIGRGKADLIEELRHEKKRARTLNVALGKEITRNTELEKKIYALEVRLYQARIRAGMGPGEAYATLARDMNTQPGRKAREAFERAKESAGYDLNDGKRES